MTGHYFDISSWPNKTVTTNL